MFGVAMSDSEVYRVAVFVYQVDRMIIDAGVLGEFRSQVLRKREVSILDGDLCRSLPGNQASYLRSTGKVDICINHPFRYSGWLDIVKPTVVLVDFLPLGFVTKLTAYW